MNSPKLKSPSSETSLAKTHDTGEESTEKEPSSKSKIYDTEPRISELQTNILESDKINVPSSDKDSANLSAEKEKDTEETSLNSPKLTYLSVETSLAKYHDTNQESIEKEDID